MKEFWRQYKRTPYEVSTEGKVRRLRLRDSKGRPIEETKLLKEQKDKLGRIHVSLKINGKQSFKALHLMVAETFIKKPPGAIRVIFKDGNFLNITRKNLAWKKPEITTCEEILKKNTKKYKRGSDHWANKSQEDPLTENEVELVRNSKEKVVDIASRFKISRAYVYMIKKGLARRLG